MTSAIQAAPAGHFPVVHLNNILLDNAIDELEHGMPAKGGFHTSYACKDSQVIP